MIGRFLGLGIGALALAMVAQQALAQSPQVKRGLALSRRHSRLQRLPHAGQLSRQARCLTQARRLPCRLFPSRHGRLRRPQSDAGQGNRIGQLDERADRHCDPQGKRPDGRMLAPIMPYNDFANLTKEDALAIVAYLKSLPPISNKVPGPFGPSDKPNVFVMTVLPPDVYNSLPPPPGK